MKTGDGVVLGSDGDEPSHGHVEVRDTLSHLGQPRRIWDNLSD
jgi:hypothetical protein